MHGETVHTPPWEVRPEALDTGPDVCPDGFGHVIPADTEESAKLIVRVLYCSIAAILLTGCGGMVFALWKVFS